MLLKRQIESGGKNWKISLELLIHASIVGGDKY